MNEDIVRLDTRILYLEDTVRQMNLIMMEQDRTIRRLEKAHQQLERKVREWEEKEGGESLLEESRRPPHY